MTALRFRNSVHRINVDYNQKTMIKMCVGYVSERQRRKHTTVPPRLT